MLFFVSKSKYDADIAALQMQLAQANQNAYNQINAANNQIAQMQTTIATLNSQNAELQKKLGKAQSIIKVFGKYFDKTAKKAIKTTAEIVEQYKVWKQRLEFVQKARQEAADAFEAEKASYSKQIDDARRAIDIYNDSGMYIREYGLYEPTFDFANSSMFKDRLADCRKAQKEIMKEMNNNAKNTSWSVNGSQKEGAKMIKETTKLLLKAFNGECDEVIKKVRSSNVSKSLQGIEKRAENVNKLGQPLQIYIPTSYINLKKEEVRLAYEYNLMKEQEREETRLLKEQEREIKRAQKEADEKRKKMREERKKYQQEIERMEAQKREQEKLAADNEAARAEIEALNEKIQNLLNKSEEIDHDIEVATEMSDVNAKAGYVYIISNIGSFGQDRYKIGVTRRLDPMDRVKELGGASVPFPFDVHALIFAEDAYALEAALHRHFSKQKVNLVNPRKEFFACSLDEIKEVVKQNYDKTVDFIDEPEADQYYTSLAMREAGEYEYDDSMTF